MISFFIIFSILQSLIRAPDGGPYHHSAQGGPVNPMCQRGFNTFCQENRLVTLPGFGGVFQRVSGGSFHYSNGMLNGTVYKKMYVTCAPHRTRPGWNHFEYKDWKPAAVVVLESDPYHGQ